MRKREKNDKKQQMKISSTEFRLLSLKNGMREGILKYLNSNMCFS